MRTQSKGSSRTARALGCAFLLTLLALCGFMGANRPEETVSVAVTRQTLEQSVERSTPEEIRERFASEREKEIALLDSVLADARVSDLTRQSALAQKTDIAARMECEAQIRAALDHMGYAGVSVVCGAQMATLFVPEQWAAAEADRTRILDAAATQGGLSAQEVKIIQISPR